jgi:hypothetical protein
MERMNTTTTKRTGSYPGMYGSGLWMGDLVRWGGNLYILGNFGMPGRRAATCWNLHFPDGMARAGKIAAQYVEPDEIELVKTIEDINWERMRVFAP